MARWSRILFKSIGGLLILLLSAVIVSAPAQTVLLNEQFNNLSNWDDLSLSVTWGGNTMPVSAFLNSGGTVTLTADAKSNSGYTSTSSLKTFTCLDFLFPYSIDHNAYGLTIDFRARWSETIGSGEGSRFMIVVNHDYPTGGLDLDLNDRYDDFDAEWWARPAYQVRLRGPGSSTIMQYGGGLDPLGEYEIYQVSGVPQWWLPGFVSSPGGLSPNPGVPGCVVTGSSLFTTSWKNFRYVITPTQQEIWVDDNGNGLFETSNNERKAVQSLTSDPANPDYFYFFENLDGARLYWRGANASQVELDWLTITTDQSGPITVQLVFFEARQEGGRVRLEWQAEEHNHAGYHLYRRDEINGGWKRLNELLITPDQCHPAPGRYVYDDEPEESGACRYRLQAVDLSGAAVFVGMAEVNFAVTVARHEALSSYSLRNYPNPFNPATTIEFELARNEQIAVQVLDVHGRVVRTLFRGEAVESAAFVWDGLDESGSAVPSGVYFYRLTTPTHSQTGRMILLR